MENIKITKETLFNCEGWKATNRLGIIATTHNIVIQNHIILKELLEKIHNNPDTYSQEEIHLSQYIFNFLSSTAALIDHSRRIMKFYTDTDIYNDYKYKSDENFAKNPLAQFIKKLRNYNAHYETPFPYPTISKQNNNSLDIVLDTQELLKCPEAWDNLSKQYIEQCGNEINILEMCNNYNNLINQFYSWLYNELKSYHKKDLEEKNNIAKQLGLSMPKI